DLAAAGGDVVNRGRQVGGGGHACLVDQDEGLGVDAFHPRGRAAVVGVPHQLGQGVGADLLPTRAPRPDESCLAVCWCVVCSVGVDGGAEFLGCDRGGCQADD